MFFIVFTFIGTSCKYLIKVSLCLEVFYLVLILISFYLAPF